MSCLWRCLRWAKCEHPGNKVEGWSLLSDDHAIVYMDATEDDLLEARGETEDLRQIQNVLSSEAAQVMDEGMKQMLKDYMEAKTRTMAQRNFMDTININSRGVAQDVMQIMDVGQRQIEIEHLLGSVINPMSVQSSRPAADNGGLQLPPVDSSKEDVNHRTAAVAGKELPTTLVRA